MKKQMLMWLFLGVSVLGWGQGTAGAPKDCDDEKGKEAKVVFEELNTNMIGLYTLYNVKIDELIQFITTDVNKRVFNNDKINKLIKEVNDYSEKIKIQDQYYKTKRAEFLKKEITDDCINTWYTFKLDNFISNVSSSDLPYNDIKYFGAKRTLTLDDTIDREGYIKAIDDILNLQTSKVYFANIHIPKHLEELPFYVSRRNISFDPNNPNKIATYSGKYYQIAEKYKFKRVSFEIKDGYLNDIVVQVEDQIGNTHVFTNSTGISILFFDQSNSRNFLHYKYTIRNHSTSNDLEMSYRYIKLTDVLGYEYRVGNNYIPHDISIELPDEQHDNIDRRAVYRIMQETDLEKMVELRTYTDFLGLFDGQSNGIVQIEGRAKFYLFPYPMNFFMRKGVLGQIEILPSISPYVNYARFENDAKYVNFEPILDSSQVSTGQYQAKRPFDLIEKRFLTMGIDVDFIRWKHKNAPLCLTAYGLVSYNLADIKNDQSDYNPNLDTVHRIQARSLGFGLELSAKRFNNFGFNYKAEFSWFNYKDFNAFSNHVLPVEIPVFRNEIEVSYSVNNNANSAIFVRLNTYNYKGSSNNDAFYQFQFGYKFAVGNRVVNSTNGS